MKSKTHIRLLVVSMLIVFLYPSIPGAETADSEQPATSLNELLEEAKRRNPEILAAREALEAARHHVSVARGYPDPSFTYTYFPANIETRLGPQRYILQLVQPLPFPGKLSLKGNIAAYDAKIRGERLNGTILNVLKSIKETYVSLAAIDEAMAVLIQEKEIFDRFGEIVRTRLETGRGYQQDLLKIRIERSKLEERALNYEKWRFSLTSSLNALLNRSTDSPISVDEIESVNEIQRSLDELEDLALQRPEILAAELHIRQRHLAQSLARRQYWPDFTLGMSYINIGESPTDIPRSGEDAWNVSIGVRLPLWFGKVRGGVKEAASMIRYLERDLDALKARTRAEIHDLHNQYRIALDLVTLYREDLIPRAEQSLQSAVAGYVTGDVDFLYLLDCERLLLELRITLAERKADVETKIAGIEALVATELVQRR